MVLIITCRTYWVRKRRNPPCSQIPICKAFKLSVLNITTLQGRAGLTGRKINFFCRRNKMTWESNLCLELMHYDDNVEMSITILRISCAIFLQMDGRAQKTLKQHNLDNTSARRWQFQPLLLFVPLSPITCATNPVWSSQLCSPFLMNGSYKDNDKDG